MADVSPHVLRLFADELAERTRSIDADLLKLENGPGSERSVLIAELLREAHSLKGAAGSIGAAQISEICHGIEDLLSAARDDQVRLDDGLLDTLFSRVDQLREASRAFMPVQPPEARPVPRSADTSAAVRVAADKLDLLLRESGELMVANHHASERLEEATAIADSLRSLQRDSRTQPWRARLREIERSLSRITSNISHGQMLVRRASSRVDAAVRRIRMVPFAHACEGLDRLVRDAARSVGRRVVLHIQNGDIEIDRAIAQRLRDPLVHLVRNAVDHGIEPPERRVAIGKPDTGTIEIAATLRGAGIEVSVRDDGAGFDVEALRQRAIDRGFSGEDDTLVFLPGVSTAKAVTNISGRGVGLDAVRTSVESLRGTIAVSSVPGSGARFVLSLPLTLTTLRAILVELNDVVYAIDQTIVDRIDVAEHQDVRSIGGRATLVRNDAQLPLVPLRGVLGLPPPDASERLALVVVDAGTHHIAFIVDAILDEREIVVHSLGPRLERARAIAGATILSDGTLALIARSSYVIERALEQAQSWRLTPVPTQEPAARAQRVLLVDDSITTRTLECSILEAAGYAVTTAADGAQALALLEHQAFDIVISDVDMPKLDGFGLTSAIRKSERLRDLPVVLVTARGSDDDRRRGVESGADAYILKSGFDQRDLLDTMRTLIA